MCIPCLLHCLFVRPGKATGKAKEDRILFPIQPVIPPAKEKNASESDRDNID